LVTADMRLGRGIVIIPVDHNSKRNVATNQSKIRSECRSSTSRRTLIEIAESRSKIDINTLVIYIINDDESFNETR
jgi:hypothetical protein